MSALWIRSVLTAGNHSLSRYLAIAQWWAASRNSVASLIYTELAYDVQVGNYRTAAEHRQVQTIGRDVKILVPNRAGKLLINKDIKAYDTVLQSTADLN